MKKLINKKTGEVAYLNEENQTIYFSKTKTTHNATIITNPKNDKITKIIASEQTVSVSKSELKHKSKPQSTPKSKTSINTHNNKISTPELEFIYNPNYSILFPETEYFEELPESTDSFPEISYQISA